MSRAEDCGALRSGHPVRQRHAGSRHPGSRPSPGLTARPPCGWRRPPCERHLATPGVGPPRRAQAPVTPPEVRGSMRDARVVATRGRPTARGPEHRLEPEVRIIRLAKTRVPPQVTLPPPVRRYAATRGHTLRPRSPQAASPSVASAAPPSTAYPTPPDVRPSQRHGAPPLGSQSRGRTRGRHHEYPRLGLRNHRCHTV